MEGGAQGVNVFHRPRTTLMQSCGTRTRLMQPWVSQPVSPRRHPRPITASHSNLALVRA
jgi:hypothetical protein